MIKKAIAFMLVVIMAFTMFGTAFADNERTSGLYTYAIKGNGTITITDYDWDNSSGDVYIPSMLDGYTVTAIGNDAFAGGDKNRRISLVIPSTITMIGDRAFLDTCFSTVSIPDSVMSIGTHAFDSVSKFIVAASQPKFAEIDGALYEKSSKKLICYVPNATIPEGIIEIGSYAAKNCDVIGSIPSTVKVIGDYAFMDALCRQTLPNITTIGVGAFASYNNKLISLPGTIKTIPEYAFWGVNVESLEEGIEEIGDYAFAAVLPRDAPFSAKPADNLSVKVNEIFQRKGKGFPSSLKKIGKCAFAYTCLYPIMSDGDYFSLYIPENVDFIGEKAFQNVECKYEYGIETKTIKIRGGHSGIGEYAFSGMVLKEHENLLMGRRQTTYPFDVVISDGIATLPEGMFMSTRISSLELAEGIITISKEAFSGAWFIETLKLPASVKEIGDYAFYISGINTLVIPEGSMLTSIGENAFGSNSFTEAYLPSTVESIGENAFDKTKVTLIVEENSYAALWAQENGYSYRYNGGNALDWLNN